MAIRRRLYDPAKAPAGTLETQVIGGRQYYFTVSHVGLVVELGSTYIGDGESVYWAMTWNPTTKAFEQIGYADDRSNPPGTAKVDAPAAILAGWAADKARRAAAAEADRVARAAQQREAEARLYAITPRRGSIVRVVKGRKIPLGVEGIVVSVHESGYGPSVRLQFGQPMRTEFTAMSNLEVIRQPEEPARQR